MASVHSLGQWLVDDAEPVAAAWIERLHDLPSSHLRRDGDQDAPAARCRMYLQALGRYLVSREDRPLRDVARGEAEEQFHAHVALEDAVAPYRRLQDLLWDQATDGPGAGTPELGLWDLSGAIMLSIEETIGAYQTLLAKQLRARPKSPAPAAPARPEATVDEVTGLFSGRVCEEYLPREIRRAQRYARPLALLVFDIDDFTHIVELCGSGEADRVVCELSELVPRGVREVDILCRLEADKFAVILPETPLAAAAGVAERVRAAAEAHPGFAPQVRASGPVRVSVGVAGFPGDAETAADLLARADAACAHAKRLGKNQVISFGDTVV